MNDIGFTLALCAGQVTLFATLGGIVYALAQRLAPRATLAVALTNLLLVVALTALAFLPLPGWWDAGLAAAGHSAFGSNLSHVNSEANHAAADFSAQIQLAADGDSVRHEKAFPSAAATFWNSLGDALARQPALDAESPRVWPLWVAGVVFAALVLGAIRLACGMLAVWRLSRQAAPIKNAELLEQLDVLIAEMNCLRRVEIHVSQQLATAATVGWRRPVIFLPPQWTTWSTAERRAVLAHELAHICRGDYAVWVATQVGLLLHFYHPLVHWLTGRLRMEQELAADALAARYSGGHRSYLASLARLALAQPDQSLSWPAQTFLPSRDTFLRRIKMLRDTSLQAQPPARVAKPFLVATLIVVVAGVAGLRGPLTSLPAVAQQSPATKNSTIAAAQPAATQPAANPLDLKYVPGDAIGVVAFRPAAVLSRLGLGAAAEGIVKGVEELGLSVDKIEQITGVLSLERQENQPSSVPGHAMVIRAAQPHDWMSHISGKLQHTQIAEYAGVKYYKSTQPGGQCSFLPDDRTIVLVNHETMVYRFILRSQGAPAEHAFKQAWADLGAVDLALAINVKAVRPKITEEIARAPAAAPFGAFAPLWEEAQVAVAGLSVNDRIRIQLAATCQTAEGAVRCKETAAGAITLAGNLLRSYRQQLDKAPPEQAAMVAPFLGLADELLKSAKFEADGAHVKLTLATAEGETSKQGVAFGMKGLLAAIDAARRSARGMQSANNLKQLALAMHNYHDVHGKFPAAATLGADGKTTHSWRVALLPYLEQAPTYQKYRFDEPWQSPSNARLSMPMTPIFRHPQAPENSSNSSYFVLTGPDTIFSGSAGLKLLDITDGTSNTILLVEAKRDIPWMKPEDIPYAADKPLPELGGYDPSGFWVAFADGSVRKLPKTIDEKVLRSLITRNGGELIDHSAIGGTR